MAMVVAMVVAMAAAMAVMRDGDGVDSSGNSGRDGSDQS